MGKTAKPSASGNTISRNGKQFTLKWKINAKKKLSNQQVRYSINGGKWSKPIAVGKKATSKSIDVNTANVKSVAMQVRDDEKGKNKWSNWAGGTFNINKPPKSVCSMALDDTHWNKCNISYGHDESQFSSGDHVWYQTTERRTTFHDENHPDNWTEDTVNNDQLKNYEANSFSKQESSLDLSSGLGYVRKYAFRVKGKHPERQEWVECKHYYSIPYAPVIKSAEISQSDVGGINCAVTWNSKTTEFHPIDYTTVQYGISAPGPGMSCPASISWSDRPTVGDNPDGDDADRFYIDTTMDTDQCLFVRVFNTHDHNKAYSKPVMATGITMPLTTPSGFSVTPDDTTHRVVVTIENNSSVPDSNIAIIYRSVLGGIATEEIIGILPNGVETATLQCPNYDLADEWSLGAFAFVGDYGSYILTEDTSVVAGKTYYTRTGNEEQTATAIQNPTGNPHTSGYYEKINDEYFISDDTEVISGKTYYTLSEIVRYEYTIVSSPAAAQLSTYYELSATVYKSVSYTVGATTYTYYVYEIPTIRMRSKTLWRGGDIPKAPTDVIAVCPREGVALVTWNWTWKSADIAELSWSDHDDAWESTDQPQTYRIDNAHAAKWSIYGLDSGVTWYIRVRLIKTTDGGENPGPWSDISNESTLDMAAAPNTPILTCSKLSTTHDGSFTVSWEYESNDGTDQIDATLINASLSNTGEVVYGSEIVPSLGTNRSVDLIPDNIEGWATGNRYGFVLKVISESGKHSPWSSPEFITIAEPLVCNISSTSLSTRGLYIHTTDTVLAFDKTYYTVFGTEVVAPDVNDLYSYYELSEGVYIRTDDGVVDDEKTYYTITGTAVETPDVSDIGSYYEYFSWNILTEMPLTLSASVSGGVDNSRYTSVTIERASSYFVNRPDETTYSGYIGETVYSSSVDNPSSISIAQEDLIGNLDDTAYYKLTVITYDELDQVAEDSVYFYVAWAHQAAIPGATVEFDSTYSVVKITPSIDPEKYAEGDTFDIYRLSVDKPVLIVKGGQFGETYVDPYPTIGVYGGHRVVTTTANGDFISNDDDSDFAWIDLDYEDGDIFLSDFPIVNFGEGSFQILYNVDLSTNWTKDFRETRYLGGHIQGDWNAGIHRDSTINSVILREEDYETATLFRRMAEYPGICHIRTLDGSNYYADIQVSETIPHNEDPTTSYSFKITRVDSDGYDGIELSEWNKIIGE